MLNDQNVISLTNLKIALDKLDLKYKGEKEENFKIFITPFESKLIENIQDPEYKFQCLITVLFMMSKSHKDEKGKSYK